MSTDFDPSRRELCPDGTCIGVIGPDGRCKECGMASPTATQDPRFRGLRSEDEVEAELEANIASSDLDPPPEDFEERRLCPDGACVGLIGPTGLCTECGRAAEA
jgi:hypothetical protein